MTKFQNHYRIESARHPHHDYSQTASYFITICTRFRLHWFGEINNGTMQLSELGEVITRNWRNIPEKFPCITLDNYVVMPDHFHAILHVNNPNTEIMATFPNQQKGGITGKHNAMLYPTSLGKIIRSFKAECSKEIRSALNPEFEWLSRYHDRIIRNQLHLKKCRNYILKNPSSW